MADLLRPLDFTARPEGRQGGLASNVAELVPQVGGIRGVTSAAATARQDIGGDLQLEGFWR